VAQGFLIVCNVRKKYKPVIPGHRVASNSKNFTLKEHAIFCSNGHNFFPHLPVLFIPLFSYTEMHIKEEKSKF
jgi:hypothetical protein